MSGTALYGDILALIACALVTFYFMFGQSVRKRVSLITYTFVVYSISSIVLLLYVVIRGEPLIPYNTFNWSMFILLAIFPTLLGHSIIKWSLKWLKASLFRWQLYLNLLDQQLWPISFSKKTSFGLKC